MVYRLKPGAVWRRSESTLQVEHGRRNCYFATMTLVCDPSMAKHPPIWYAFDACKLAARGRKDVIIRSRELPI
jgi:hypothetical protein